jgi:hypothetical protein
MADMFFLTIFEVFASVITKIPVFEHVTLGRVVSYVYPTFQMNLLLLSERQMDACLMYADDESSRFIQNVGTRPQVYTVSHSKKMVFVLHIVHFNVPSHILLSDVKFPHCGLVSYVAMYLQTIFPPLSSSKKYLRPHRITRCHVQSEVPHFQQHQHFVD